MTRRLRPCSGFSAAWRRSALKAPSKGFPCSFSRAAFRSLAASSTEPVVRSSLFPRSTTSFTSSGRYSGCEAHRATYWAASVGPRVGAAAGV
eukprot:180012-Pyramimonas_sp.AAC.1